MLKVSIDFPNLISGELEINDITVLMGKPMSGKTTLLRLIYDVIYASNSKVVPLEANIIAHEFLDGEMRVSVESGEARATITCSSFEETTCNFEGDKIGYNALFFPSEMEYILKYGYCPVYYESYSAFYSLINKLKSGVKVPSYAISLPKGFITSRLEVKDFQLYENGEIRAELSSSSSLKLSFIVALLEKGLLGDPKTTLLLFDDVQENLHAEYMLKLAYLLGLMASKGYKILLTTHNLGFLSFLACIKGVQEALGYEEEFKITPRLYVVENKRIEEYSIASSAIPTYTDVFLNVYKRCG